MSSTRPECFEFAMEFLGDPEAVEVRAYVERLEAATTTEQAEQIRLAYKTGYDEGYSDGSDGSTDHDACEEGWQQYRTALATAPQETK